MKPLNYIAEAVYISKTVGMGRGVFTREALKKNTIIEVAPVIVMSAADRQLLDKTVLHDYIFEWGDARQQCCMALGYIALYNHAYRSNCEYEMNFRKQTMVVRTVRDIEAGEELFINYNGDWDNERTLWFDAK